MLITRTAPQERGEGHFFGLGWAGSLAPKAYGRPAALWVTRKIRTAGPFGFDNSPDGVS